MFASRLLFIDPSPRSKHHLKLYAEGNPPLTTKKPVVKESYDEIVFNEPQLSFFHRVRSNPMLQVHGTPAALAAAHAMADAGEMLNIRHLCMLEVGETSSLAV